MAAGGSSARGDVGIADFILALRTLKVGAGNPSLQELQRRSGVARSTLADALNPRRRELPRLELVLALVRACGGGPAEEARWKAEWRRVARAADERRVASSAPEPALTPAGATTAPANGGTPNGSPPDGSTPAAGPGPDFLPPGLRDFTARERELEVIVGAAANAGAGAPVLLAIDGMAGVGKTAIAVQSGHQVAHRFPDGRFYLDLHAHTEGQDPVDPATALATLLRARGRAADTIPLDATERAAAWRAETAGLRVLLVVDNAATADQVRPLLPGSGGSMVLVTSRRRLTSLEGAHSLPLDLLPVPDATLLFRRVLGDRADAGEAGVEEIVELCGRLPLAIRIAAARLKHRPSWPIGALAARLRDERRRLGELATSDLAVSAAFQTSFSHVGERERRVFTLLGLVPGPDIDALAAAALTALPADQADRSLEELLDIHLVEQLTVDRYTLHDLLRIHCVALAAGLPDQERGQARRRLLDHYRYRASLAMDAAFPQERSRRPEIKPPGPDDPTNHFADRASALDWLDAERTGLISASGLSGFPQQVIDLSAILARYLELGAHGSEGRLLHQRALEFARALRDPAAEAGALRYLGLTHLQNEDFTAALDVLLESLTVLRQSGQRQPLPSTLNNLGAVYGRLGRLEQSADHFEQAVVESRKQGDEPNETRAIANLGLSRRRQGRLDEALLLQREALDLARRSGNALSQSVGLDNLGVLYRLLGRPEEALEQHREALVLDRESNDRFGEAITIDNLGLAYQRLGDHAAALTHFEAALGLGRELHNVASEGIALGNIGNVLREQGDIQAALKHHRRALELFQGGEDAPNLAEALNNLGETLFAAGSPAEALALHQRALELADSCGDLVETARTRDLLGHAQHAVGDHPAAREQHALALAAYRRMGLPQAAVLGAHICRAPGDFPAISD